ncbi:MAG: TIGR02452 family protein [Bacteroidaceae bacterium]|nr:TIGR02452 family protein [Bacteroidaceae bacterium]
MTNLISIYQETIADSFEGEFNNPSLSKLYSEEVKLGPSEKDCFNTAVSVINKDCLDAAKEMLDEGLNPAVLNMANAFRPGGGVLHGARAQEECIFRRSNLFMSLYRFDKDCYDFVIEPNKDEYTCDLYDLDFIEQGYPLNTNFGGIYSEGVTVFKDTRYEWLYEPFETSFITVAALNVKRAFLGDEPAVKNGLLTGSAVAITKNKIRTIYRMGILHGHDSLVLGAWGCGAFGNPPCHMAQLFIDVLNENEFKGRYKDIRFAIIEDHNSKGINYTTFKDVIEKC